MLVKLDHLPKDRGKNKTCLKPPRRKNNLQQTPQLKTNPNPGAAKSEAFLLQTFGGILIMDDSQSSLEKAIYPFPLQLT